MDLAPRHRQPLRLPGHWPDCAPGLLRHSAAWLHTGDSGESLLVMPGKTLVSRWDGQAWVTQLDGVPLAGSPWEALASTVARQSFPWVGAASFELACDEAGHPRQPLEVGALGQHWTGVALALQVNDGRAELWSWGDAPTAPPEGWSRPTMAPLERRSSVDLASLWTEAQHRFAVEEIQARILDGGFYVANLCVPFSGKLSGDAVALALSAFQRARPPFGALLDLGGLQLLSLSMERLLSRRGARLCSQPIKGSAPLTGDPVRDRTVAEALLADPKERAEHTMILDLVRNDLGRVAVPGSVQVTRLMSVEPYPTVQHLVSTLEAMARPDLGLAELLRAMLPGGSVTGAPKHAVCGHLAQAEAGPRGFYCGAVGWISPEGDLDLALPIRTAQIEGDNLTYWTGGGITRRSDPAREWAELHLKTRAITG